MIGRFSGLLSRGALGRLTPLATDIAHNPEALKALDKQLLHSARAGGLTSKIIPTYGRYVAKPASISSSLLYGSKMDPAKIIATLGGTFGGIRYGGEAARPLYGYLRDIGKTIAGPEMAANKYFTAASPDSVLNIVKPAVALTSKPMAFLDSALFNKALHMAENPLLASVALPFAAYGAARGGGALISRLSRARRLAQLQRGLAPKAYYQQAKQLGFK